MILLIDADILIYQVASSAEEPIDWGEDFWTLHSDFDAARTTLDSKIERLRETLGAEHMLFALTSTLGNFRKEVYPLYKSNRKAVRKPLVWKPLRQYLAEKYWTYERPMLEGDDCIGILATLPVIKSPDGKVLKGDRVVVSIDKDFKTIPCTYYNLNHPEDGLQIHNQTMADYWHIVQTLTGDTTDGYPGCPGIGPKKAEAILEEAFTGVEFRVDLAWPKVVAAYKKANLGEEVALQQARCARILRATDYNFKEKKPILWVPPALKSSSKRKG